ncbi:cytochrome P450 3A31 [Trichonephila clavipes]|nr:cytochrome P450 3A31 [Trichonephila clavipes]
MVPDEVRLSKVAYHVLILEYISCLSKSREELLFEENMEVFIALLCIAVVLSLAWRWKQTSVFQKLGIPGPKPSLIFGNILELYKKGPVKCHEEWVKKHGRVLGYYYGMKPVLLVTDPYILKDIFIKDFNKFINREV